MPIQFAEGYWSDSWTHKRGLRGKIKGCILAAGLEKRMKPLTVSHLPKPMFPLGGKIPMAEIWVRRFIESGITNISMNLCVLSETVKRYFEDGSKYAADIKYIDEDLPSGTLGGVCKHGLGKKARQVFNGEKASDYDEFEGSTLIVPSGDVVTNFGSELLEQMYEIHNRVGSAFTMVLVPIPWERRKDFGTVVLDNPDPIDGIVSKYGRIKEFREKDPNSKSNLNNASIYMIEMELLKYLDKYRTEARVDIKNPYYDFGKHVFPSMLKSLEYLSLPKDFTLWGIQYDGRWFDVGQKRDYLQVNKALLDGELNMELPYEKLPWGYLGTNTKIDFSKVTIVPPVIIGNNCIIEPGSTLGPYAVIGDDWVVEKGARVSNAVLWGRYSFFTKDGVERSPNDRKLVDRHEVRRNVSIESAIVVGGAIQTDIKEKTVDVLEDGKLSILPIDYVPGGERA